MYDLIGDIHGHANTLVALLGRLGYEKHKGVYRHTERTAIFLGDFIDRGPQIRETLEIVRPMVDAGSASAVMGKHELTPEAEVGIEFSGSTLGRWCSSAPNSLSSPRDRLDLWTIRESTADQKQGEHNCDQRRRNIYASRTAVC